MTKKEAVANPDETVWGNMTHTFGLRIRAKKSCISARPLLIMYPTGCCMNELAIRIHRAETLEPMATSQMAAACIFLESLSHPKIQIPRKVDSRKKASSAS